MNLNLLDSLCDDLGYGDCSCYGQNTRQTLNIVRTLQLRCRRPTGPVA